MVSKRFAHNQEKKKIVKFSGLRGTAELVIILCCIITTRNAFTFLLSEASHGRVDKEILITTAKLIFLFHYGNLALN